MALISTEIANGLSILSLQKRWGSDGSCKSWPAVHTVYYGASGVAMCKQFI